jgi:MoaA/NifB/PqqE/SkfB family radical SAM enzyme
MEEFRKVCQRIKQLKRELKNVFTSDYFFDTLPTFYEKREIPNCDAGKIMIHVSPKGMVQPCAELPSLGHYSEFEPQKFAGTGCGRCFDACRAEPQAPLTLRRIGELTGVL